MKVTNKEILEIELELTGTCNLDCPLCARNYEDVKNLKGPNARPLKDIIIQLDAFINLKNVCIAGIMSEPTLYKELFDLIMYLQNRNIEIELYSNADTHDVEYWRNLGKICNSGTKVFFTICGSVEKIHSLYRVGSSINNILLHLEAFQDTNKHKCDYLQHIMFNYNKDDFKHMTDIRSLFNNECNIQSLPYQERFDIKNNPNNIKMTEELSSRYKNIIKFGKSKLKDPNARLNCKSLETKFLALDQFGESTPCFLYRLYLKEAFDQDYSKILNGEYDFCYECESNTCNLLEKNNLERMT